MKGWKLLAGTLALGVGLTGAAAAQSQSWGDHARDGRRGQSWSWQDDDHRQDQDRDRDRDRNGDRRDDRYRRDGQYGRYGNNGYYGRGDGDRDDGYRNGRYGNGGYRDGQNGYYGGGHGRYGYGNEAGRIGYQEGFNYGQNDRSRGRGFNATGSEAYEEADAGYNSSFGDKNAYRQTFRDAYVQGYQAGYGRRY